MVRYLSHVPIAVTDDTLTRKILIFYELFACISIVNADVSLSYSSAHCTRADVVVILCLRLGNGSTIVFQQHADIESQLIRSLGVTLTFCHEGRSGVTDAVLGKNDSCLGSKNFEE